MMHQLRPQRPHGTVTSIEAASAFAEEDILLTEKELAQRWRMSPASFRTQRASGRSVIPYLKIGGSVRYRLSVVREYEDSVTQAS